MSESSAVPPTPPSVGLHPELAAAAASVAHVTEHLRALTASMTDTQFNWHPKVGEWSVAEVLDHLTTLHNLMLPRFVQGMAQAREQGWQPNPHKHLSRAHWANCSSGRISRTHGRRSKPPHPTRRPQIAHERWCCQSSLPPKLRCSPVSALRGL